VAKPRDLFRFLVLRKLERMLSVDALYRTLLPLESIRAAVNTPFRKSAPPLRLPDCLGRDQFLPMGKMRRRSHYLNQTIELFSDRLASPEWSRRCRINGQEHLQRARQQGKPLVLAFCHFEAFALLRFWLRAAGFPVTNLIRDEAIRPSIRQLTDRLTPFPEVPTVIRREELSRAIRFLKAGIPLLVAVDSPNGKQMQVPIQDGWSFQMATGAIRMAISQKAELISCAIIDEGGWHYRIELGRPVPRELLTLESDWLPAGACLLEQLLPHVRNHPEQSLAVIRRIQPGASNPALTIQNQ
jgi:lauroyl/myristoyl acyltransferase